jgi:hypothetical protein
MARVLSRMRQQEEAKEKEEEAGADA